VAVVCAGVKSILDVGATLERLESLNVAVIGYRTRRFPGFYLADAGLPLDWSAETPQEVATILAMADELSGIRRPGSAASAVTTADVGLQTSEMGALGALIVANPIPVEEQLDPALHDRALAAGLAEAARRSIRGKEVTPFLLEYFRSATGGESLRVNKEIVRNNARLAAQIACARAPAAPS
jgi:pseudouridine-5'-phosphate glycosidase